jgi:cobalt/nickel transport system permease protein
VRRGLAALGLALAQQLAPPPTRGWLSGVEARAKVVAIALLIVAVSLLHTLPVVAGGAVIAVALALSAGLRGRRLAPLFVGVPLFTLAIALPACLNVVTPGEAVWVVWTPTSHTLGPWTLPPQIAVTLPGLIVAGRFVLRALACVALALALTGTTPPAALVMGLRALGLPRVFGMILTMMQRYLVLVLRRAEELHLARLSRSLGGETVRQGQAWTAAGMGIVLLSSLRLAEGVHNAMLARGYDGDIQALHNPRWTHRELLLVIVAAALAVLLVGLDRGL